MPAYLRFVRGVVDSNDLPLNVSREILQESQGRRDDPRRLGEARARAARRSRREAARRSTRRSGRSSAACSRRASGEDPANRERIAKLLRFASTHADAEEQNVSLADYVGRMKEGQDKIYYVTAESFRGREGQPAPGDLPQEGHRGAAALRPGRRMGVSHLTEFEGKALQSVARAASSWAARRTRRRRRSRKRRPASYKDLARAHEEGARRQGEGCAGHAAPDRVAGVPGRRRARHRRNLAAHAEGGGTEGAGGAADPGAQSRITRSCSASKPGGRRRFGDLGRLLFDQALLAEGGQLEDPAGFVRRTNDLMLSLTKQ